MKMPSLKIWVCALLTLIVMPAHATTWTVLNLGDDGAGTFRYQIGYAASGDTIQFLGTLTGTLTLTTGSLNITSDVSIVGPGPATITISGNASSRIFTATNVSPTISGLTFSNGLANGSDGGVLYQMGGNITVSNCVFLNNRATGADGAAGGFGGAIYTTGGVITARACAFSNNAAVGPRGVPLVDNYSGGGGGGAGLGGAMCLFSGTGYFYQCAFNGNSVTGGIGGTAGYGALGQNGGKGGGLNGGAGGTAGSVNGVAGGEFSGGGGAKDDSGSSWGNGGGGGFGGGGGGGGGQTGSGSGGSGGVGGQLGGNGGNAMHSGGGGGGGGAGLGGALFADTNSTVSGTNLSLTGNSAAGGSGGGGSLSGANGTGAGGGIFCYGGNIAMYLTTFSSNTFSGNTADAYPDVYGALTILGTNGATIGIDTAVSTAKGTDFGSVVWGQVVTNVLAVTNGISAGVTISGVTTSGAGAAAFQVLGMPAGVSAGASSNFSVVFNPAAGGSYTCVVSITNNSATTPYIVNLAGTGGKHDQTITNFPNPGTQLTTNTVQLWAQASSGLSVTNFAVSGPGAISGLTNLTFTGSGSVSIVASQGGDTNWNPAPNVTNTFNVLPAPIPPVVNGWLAIQVAPTSGIWQLSAPAGYTGPTAGTGNLAAVSAVIGQYCITYSALSGYVAPSNQSQFVTGGSTTLFADVYLPISTNIGTPAGVSATEGSYTNKIRISWQGVDGAIGYEVWRSQTNDPATAGRIADIPKNGASNQLSVIGDQSSTFRLRPSAYSLPGYAGALRRGEQSTAYYYDDYAINPIYAYYYWVRAKTATLISPMSYVGMGYAALDPNAAQGTADIAVSDLVFLPVNMTNLSHAGTVSCRLANNGPDALNAAAVAFDFHMGSNDTAMVWVGSDQGTYTLATGQEQLVILTPSAKRGLTVREDLSGILQVKVTVRHMSALNDQNLANNTTTAAGSVRIKPSGVNSPGRSLNDYDGDGKSDACLYQSALGRWYAELSGDRYDADPSIGDVGVGWTPVPGDYDGNGLTDVAAYNCLSRQWLVRYTSSGLVDEGWLGGPEFTATPCDFDGDAMTDLVVYHEADGYWLGAASSRQYVLCDASLGETGYQSVVADYDGDGLADPAVYNRTTGLWAISLSGNRYQIVTGTFGGSGYLPVSADYDGDGSADPAIYAPSTAYWQVLMSASLATQGVYTWCDDFLGTIGGIPVPADYDGDGKADPAVYHQDTGLWELFPSTQVYQLYWGLFGGPEYQPAKE